MRSIDEIIGLIESKQFNEAEEALLEMRRDDYFNPVINYLLGSVCNNYQNPNRSKDRAKQFLKYAADADKPIEQAFVDLAGIESNSNHAIRILKAGLSHFPRSIQLYDRLIARTSIDKRDAIFKEIVDNGLISKSILLRMLDTYLDLKKHDEALKLIPQIKTEEKSLKFLLDFIAGFCSYEVGLQADAKHAFKSLIDRDIHHTLDYAPDFGLILALLKEGSVGEAIEIFDDVPNEIELSPPFGPWFDSLQFNYNYYFLAALNGIEKNTKDRAKKAKARGLRGILLYNSGSYDCSKRRKIINDLVFANKNIPENTKYSETLRYIYIESNDLIEAYRASIQYFNNLSWDEAKKARDDFDSSFIEEALDDVFDQIYSDLFNRLEKGSESSMAIACGVFNSVVERLHKQKKYDAVVNLADHLGFVYLEETNVIFEVAYAYEDQKRRKEALRLYHKYVQKNPNASAAINNLAVIFEKEGNLQKAEELFRMAYDIDPNENLYKNNLQRVLDCRKAARFFDQEEFSIRTSLLYLWQRRGIDGIIKIQPKELSEILTLSSEEAKKRVNYLLDNIYLLKIKDQSIDSSSPVYRVNPDIEPQMPSIEHEHEKEHELTELIGDISLQSLRSIGYNDKLINALKKVSSHDLQKMLERDLKEAAVAFLAKSFKASLILCGSIIETLLLDKITAKKITKYKMEDGKNRSVLRMDLSDILYVSLHEGIIDDQIFHLAHALRGFRNLIHPGVEQRKRAIEVNNTNARIAWDITLKLILDI